ncbi:MAG: DUF6569 family protein [bacterium]
MIRNRSSATAASVLALALAASVSVANPARRLLELVRVQRPMQHRNITLFPLTGPSGSAADFTLLDEAIRSGRVEVQEKDGGVVNTVRMRNTGKGHVFGMAGEIISGAKQDRMLEHDVLLPPGSAWLDVPVYCTEHGRWAGSSARFESKGQVVAGRVRARAAQSGSQSEVWDEVGATRRTLGVATPTEAFAKVYEDSDVQEQTRSYHERFDRLPALNPEAVGVAVAVGDRLVCVDLFASSELFRQMWPKLLRSYVIDAVAARPEGRLGVADVASFVRAAARGSAAERSNVGTGSLWRLSGAGCSGSALTFRGGIVHLDLFPDERFSTDRSEEGDAPRLDIRRQGSHR